MRRSVFEQFATSTRLSLWHSIRSKASWSVKDVLCHRTRIMLVIWAQSFDGSAVCSARESSFYV